MPPSSSSVRAGKAFVELSIKNQIAKGLARAEKQVKGFGRRVATIGAGMTASASAIVAPLVQASRYFAGAGDDAAKLAKRLGISAAAATELGFAATQSGTDIAGLGAAMFRARRRIANAAGSGMGIADGAGPAKRALDELGLSAEKLSKIPADQQLGIIADALNRVPDAARATQLGFEILGDNFRSLKPLIDSGSKGIADLRKQARALGVTMSDEDAASAEQLTDAMDRLSHSTKMFAFRIGASLAPSLIKFYDWTTRGAVALQNWVDQNRPAIATAFGFAAALGVTGIAVTAAGVGIIGLGAAIGSLTTIVSASAAVIAALTSPIGIATTAVVGLGGAILHYSGAGGAALEWLAKRFESLSSFAMKAWQGIGDAIAAGDLGAAANIAWLSLRLAWEKGIAELKRLWANFKINFMKIGAEAFAGVVRLGNDGWYSLRHGMIELMSFLGRQWTELWTGFQSIQSEAIAKMERSYLDLYGLIDSDFDVKGAKELSRQREQREQNDLAVNQDRKLREIAAERKLLLKGNQVEAKKQAKEIEAARKIALAAIDAHAKKQTSQTQTALDQAREKWKKAIEDAGAKAAEMDRSGFASQIEEFRAKVGDFSQEVADTVATKVEQITATSGTFRQGALIELIGDRPVQERIAASNEKIVTNTDRLVRKPGPSFT